ncbi:hypothetical protein PCO31110_02724 [Pandoraea communis]|uniref:DUF2975 domain-containing protein n=2 Tax=Burkholderiaceae TaxID=119060 RepID=A0A5E4VLR1_9BURK|nr:hypothetical protein C266_04294 [Pandoraea sp. SD6-2]VVE12304.1 hypothetical protein PCO31110_02724 [Pandoraea communis]
MVTNKTLPPGASAGLPEHLRRIARIRRLSNVMAWACLTVPVLLVLGMLRYWTATSAADVFRHAGLGIAPPATLDALSRVGGFAISMVPLAALVFGLLAARQCFRLFANDQALTAAAVRSLRTFAVAMAVSAALQPLAGAALSVLLSALSPERTWSLAVNVGSDTLLQLLFSGIVAVIAWVLVDATEIADEHRQFV